MGLLALTVGVLALVAWFVRPRAKPTPAEDERARTIGSAIANMPMMDALGAVGPPEFVSSPTSSDYEPDGDKVITIDGPSEHRAAPDADDGRVPPG